MSDVFINIPNSGSRHWLNPVSTFANLPVSAGLGDAIVVQDTQNIYVWNGTMWVLVAGPGMGSAITSINGLTATAQTLVTGTAGTDFNIVSSGSTHTFNLPVADATHTGKLSSTDWVTFNSKQTSTLTNTHIFVGNASNVATDVALSGDATLANTGALTLATVNSNVGTFGSSTSIPTFTVNAKGLITAASGNVVIAPAGTLTGTTLASNVVNSSLTSVGTITTGTWNGSVIDIAHGGTNSSAALNNNRIMQSSGGAIVEAPAITANRALISNSSGIPIASVTTNTELAFVSGVTSSIQTQLNSKLNLSGGTMSGVIDMGSNKIINLTDPTNPQDAATKFYVDTLNQGISWKNTVESATTGVLPAYTYNNGSSGVGATITANSNGALPAQDGVTLLATQRFLVKNETGGNQPNNGIYIVTQVGDGSHPFILTRSTDMNTTSEFNNATVQVNTDAVTQGGFGYRQSTDDPVIGTSNIVWVNFSIGTAYNFNNGLLLTGATVNVVPGDNSLTATPGSLIVKEDPAGAISTGASGIKVNVDNSTIDISGNNIEVKLLGITNAQIANATINLTTKVTGILPIANGGTNASTANAAFNNLSPMTTGGDLIYGGASGVGTRLANGTAGQVLQSNGGTAAPSWTTNISGNAVNVTGIVAIANGGTGQTTANAGFNALSPLTTKGDVLGYSTVNARIPIGTDGQVLTADSAQTLGLKWSTPTTGTVTNVTGSGNIASSGGSTPNITFTGVLPIANGGTNGTDATVLGGIVYTNATQYKVLAAGTSGQVLTSAGAAAPTWTTPTTGTVTSVAATVPSILTISGSPITTSGTLAFGLATQSANTVFAGPSSGGATTPTFRSLVAADISFTFTQGSVIFAGATGQLTQDNSKFYWDDTNFLLGLGTIPAANNVIDVVANTASAVQVVQLTGYGVNSLGLRMRQARGTSGSPSALQTNDLLGFVGGRGYGATQFAAANTSSIKFMSDENFTDTSNATSMVFSTTPTTSVTLAERMRITAAGSVGIGTSTPLALVGINGATTGFKGQLTITDPTGTGASNTSAVFITAYGNNSAAGTSTGRKWILGNLDIGTTNDVYLSNSNGTNIFLAGATKTLTVDTANNRVGINTTSPTANLHLPASTTSASTAPLKLATGVLMTTAEAGAIEYDGTSLYYTSSTPTRNKLMINPMTTGGDLIYGGTSGVPTRLANGSNGQVLTSAGGTSAPTWTTPTTGTVTSVALTVPSFLSVSGSPITTSGTLAVTLSGTALPIANGGTGQTTASAAFGALSPLTTKGDVLGYDTANNRIPVGSNGQVLTADSTQALGVKWAAAGGGSFPTHATLWHDEDTILTGNALIFNTASGTEAFPLFYQNGPANGDSFQQTCFIAAGTYTFYVRGVGGGDRGIIDWYLNGSTFITGQDWYDSNVERIKTGSITIATGGVNTIKGVVNGKNGSSGNYYMPLEKMWIA